MKIELTKEEWEFFKRVCSRSLLFCEMNIQHAYSQDKDKIENLIKKLGDEWQPSGEV